ncbi:MAG: branched-chain amino acid transport system permease protein, partial [Pseudonocardiales bacterium]|nr:branched-chain amino acid transport system permease protein [Pseudonocardiales bacterium]
MTTPVANVVRHSTLIRHLVPTLVGATGVVVLTGQLSSFHNYQLAILGAYICAVAGLTVLTGMNGQVSLGHAALMAVGGYSVAMVQKAFTDHNASGHWLLPVSLLAGTLITAVVGGVIGVAAARLRGPYLAGATLALGVALPSITSHYTSVFKGDQGLFVTFAGPPASFGANF